MVAISSDDEDNSSFLPSNQHRKRRRKVMKLQEEDIDEEEEPPLEDAKPIGEPVRVSGKGRTRTEHFHSFEFDGNQYTLEDTVLLEPDGEDENAYVAIIKDITQSLNGGNLMITGQWFYRPYEAKKKGGGSWQSNDTRELYYSFHQDDVPAESVKHSCVVHFVPIHKQLPNRKQHPGFIVRKVYDMEEMKLWNLTDKDYHDDKQLEIDELVQKTIQRLGELPDIKTGEAPAGQEDLMKNKRNFKKKSISSLDVSREDETSRKNFQSLEPEIPGNCVANTSEHHHILLKFNALTGDRHRDKGLVMLLQNVQYLFDTNESMMKKDKGSDSSDAINNGGNNKSLETANECKNKVPKNSKPFVWPDVAVPAVVALEKASHDTFSSDYQKYNQKLRQLAFNLKNNAFLLRRLLNGELEPSKVLNMTPTELKEGLTAEELPKNEPDEQQHMQMTDARCEFCTEGKVGVRDIIRAGLTDRYMLECIACGHSWSASCDAVSVLTLDASDSKRNVGTSPWVTAKFEDAEKKKLVGAHESDKSANDIFMPPVLEAQKLVGKSRKDENFKASRRA